ncbi:hypothetical protein HY480_00400 [Candidatus Uhrbacteria bacterium]|nr:hypothetical protein [Candidatus Uhrbacteria bacterium]
MTLTARRQAFVLGAIVVFAALGIVGFRIVRWAERNTIEGQPGELLYVNKQPVEWAFVGFMRRPAIVRIGRGPYLFGGTVRGTGTTAIELELRTVFVLNDALPYDTAVRYGDSARRQTALAAHFKRAFTIVEEDPCLVLDLDQTRRLEQTILATFNAARHPVTLVEVAIEPRAVRAPGADLEYCWQQRQPQTWEQRHEIY